MGAIFQLMGRLDQAWMLGLASRRPPRWLDLGFRWGTHLGGATATLTAGLVLTLLPPTRRIGLVALIAVVSSHLVAQLLKRRFLRRRPHLVLDALAPLIPIPDEFSFPSGHASAAMAVAASIAATAPPVIGLVSVAAALFIAASRVYLRVHFVSDVVVGLGLGVGGAALGWMILPG